MSSREDWVELGDGRVLELLPPQATKRDAEEAARAWSNLRALGVQVPHVHGPGAARDRVGVIIEPPKGPDYVEWMQTNLYLFDRMFSMLAYEFHEMHLHRAPDLPSAVERMRARIESVAIDTEARAKAKKILDKNASADNVCHWNYLPTNIICTLEGPVFVHWEGVCKGPFLADMARTSVLLRLRNDEYYRSNLTDHYLKMCGLTNDDLGPWIGVVAADKLADKVSEEKDILNSLVRRHLMV